MLYEFIFEPAPRLRQHRRKVGFGSFASFLRWVSHFRSTPNFGHVAAPRELSRRTNRRLMHRSNASLFDQRGTDSYLRRR